MKIAQIVASLEARHGGPTRSVRGLAEGLALNGHAVELLTTGAEGDGQPVHVGPLLIRTFRRQWPQALARASELSDYLQDASWDVIHHHGLWLRPLHYARLAARRLHRPLVISPRGMMSQWAWNHRRWKKLPASLLVHPSAFNAASGWHATSEEEAADIRRLGFTQPVCVAPNGVIPPSPTEEAAAAEQWHALLPATANRRVALFYSRFHAKKRVLELIDLWLAKPRGDWVLLIAGIPEQYSVSQLEAYAFRNGGRGSIFVEDGIGKLPPYAIASLFLLPSHSENFGLVVAEALVRGVPVLTTDATPWQELDKIGGGHCVAWEAFAAVLDSLLAQSPRALQEAGGRAREWATPAFSWEKVARSLADFYAQLSPSR
jgi:glycosyltransferase involved in cell wall biosynthesis